MATDLEAALIAALKANQQQQQAQPKQAPSKGDPVAGFITGVAWVIVAVVVIGILSYGNKPLPGESGYKQPETIEVQK